MTSIRKAEAIRRASDEINSKKSHLMQAVDRLFEAGANREAESLNRIIARLEAWQWRNVK